MAFHVRAFLDGWYVVKNQRTPQGQYVKMHLEPYYTMQKAITKLLELNIKFYGVAFPLF